MAEKLNKFIGINANDSDDVKAIKEAHNSSVIKARGNTDMAGDVNWGNFKNSIAADKNLYNSILSPQQAEALASKNTQEIKSNSATGSNTASGSGTGETSGGLDLSKYQYNPQSDALYMEALNALNQASNSLPTYNNSYESQLQDVYNSIVNRDKFQYDVNSDALYNQYKDQYVQQGKLAMQDTMGQAAALTGGYGNSYAQSVGQQTYQGYLGKLNEVVPELYGMAYDRYNQEGQNLLNQYSMLGDMRDDEYNKYQNELNQYWQKVSYNKQLADDAYNRGYTSSRDAASDALTEYNAAYQKQQDALSQQNYNKEFDYQKQQDALSQDNYNKEFDYKKEQDALSQDNYNKEFDYKKEQDALSQDNYNKEFDYQKQQDAADRATNADNTAYNRQQDALDRETNAANTVYSKQKDAASRLISMMTSTGYNPTDSELSQAGITREQANAYVKYYGDNTVDDTSLYPEVGNGFTGDNYDEAIAYMESNGVSSDVAVGILTKSEWISRKQAGSNIPEVKNYSSYSDYLSDYVDYAINE